MSRGGRFLYLDWAQAEIISSESKPDRSLASLSAQHDGYKRLGLIHRRFVKVDAHDQWIVEDHLLPTGDGLLDNGKHQASLHWLLPDWEWKIESAEDKSSWSLNLDSAYGPVQLTIWAEKKIELPLQVQLVRGGEWLYGLGQVSPNWGWYSMTYAEKTPALALRIFATSKLPIVLVSRFNFPQQEGV